MVDSLSHIPLSINQGKGTSLVSIKIGYWSNPVPPLTTAQDNKQIKRARYAAESSPYSLVVSFVVFRITKDCIFSPDNRCHTGLPTCGFLINRSKIQCWGHPYRLETYSLSWLSTWVPRSPSLFPFTMSRKASGASTYRETRSWNSLRIRSCTWEARSGGPVTRGLFNGSRNLAKPIDA